MNCKISIDNCEYGKQDVYDIIIGNSLSYLHQAMMVHVISGDEKMIDYAKSQIDFLNKITENIKIEVGHES